MNYISPFEEVGKIGSINSEYVQRKQERPKSQEKAKKIAEVLKKTNQPKNKSENIFKRLHIGSTFVSFFQFILSSIRNAINSLTMTKKKEPTIEQLSNAAQKIAEHFDGEHFKNKGIKIEGIFRLSPEKQDFDRLFSQLINNSKLIIKEKEDAILLAVVFKKIYSEMNLFGKIDKEYKEAAQELKDQVNKEDKIKVLQKLINQLGDRKKDLQTYLSVFIEVEKNSKENRMNRNAILTCGAPSINTAPKNASAEEILSLIDLNPYVFNLLLEHYNQLTFD